ncbi:acyl carrier protein [Methylobacter sp. Wu1]|jgi:acyl carrier protein|uniref:acyl carrier protein n=1 Tax=unclassified Methylobacter TaxID=2635283 RepID=UPI00227CFAA4|nr:acyl carrier protein [Methylobacter sp. YRD-M1]WAK01060.1 acyl carrier protein [Methylobacter sp. YRD-M1]
MTEIKQEVSTLVKEFFADECEVDVNDITDNTRIIEDLDGDSLMFLSLLEIIRKKHNVEVEIKTIGKRLMKRPADTIGDLVDMALLVIEHGENIPD